MPIGRIKWFGGLNNKTKKKNNFGFIQLINSDIEQDIRVQRTDVSQEIQEIIEGREGEGIYIEFEITEDRQGRERAVNVKLLELLGVIEWFKDGRGYAKCENRPDMRISSDNFIDNQQSKINSDDLVLFAIRYNSYYKKDESFLIRKIDINTEDVEIINKCFNSSIPKIFTPFISKYLDQNQLSTSEKIKTIEETINLIDNNKDKTLIAKEICTNYCDIFRDSLLIRNLLSIDDYLLLLEDYFNNHGEDLSFYDDFMDKIHNTSHISLQVAEKINNFDIIHIIVFMGNFNIFQLFLIKYLKHLTDEDAINFILEKLTSLDKIDDRKELLNQLVDQFSSIFLLSSDLRKWLISDSYDIHQYCRFINNALTTTYNELKKELLGEVFEYIKQSDESTRTILWDRIPEFAKYLKYRNSLWNFAPKKYQQQIIKTKFENFFQLQEQFANSSYPNERHITANITDLFPLDDNSQKLIYNWDNNVNNNIHTAAQMMSARGAEKLVIKYYQNIGSQVEDISIHQVTNQSREWIQGDIRINGNTLLDVKNARTNVNSRVYSKFCVPNFKTVRSQDVKIVAVLSPYLQKKYLIRYNSEHQPYKFEKISEFIIKVIHKESKQYYQMNPNGSYSQQTEYRFEVFAPAILGTFQKSQLIEIEQYFSSDLISINMTRGIDTNNYLPHWVFDYEEDFYVEQINIIREFRHLSEQDIPLYEDLQIIGDNYQDFLPLFMRSQVKIPENWSNEIPSWKINFMTKVIGSGTYKISLPYVFLSVLTHFLKMLSQPTEEYEPNKYLALLGSQHPLKLYDPLNTIADFCSSLQNIWENREQVKLNEFKIFQFNGKGLLIAQRFEGESPTTTILAYCGGWIEGKGNCGYKPLVIGKHKNCHVCGHLICPKDDCQFCSNYECFGYLERKQNQNQNQNNEGENDDIDNIPF